jgi:hypothetical protein
MKLSDIKRTVATSRSGHICFHPGAEMAVIRIERVLVGKTTTGGPHHLLPRRFRSEWFGLEGWGNRRLENFIDRPAFYIWAADVDFDTFPQINCVCFIFGSHFKLHISACIVIGEAVAHEIEKVAGFQLNCATLTITNAVIEGIEPSDFACRACKIVDDSDGFFV